MSLAYQDTSTTWRGRKAVLNNGIYSFQSNSTSGLTYSSVTPVVGKIYADGALVTIASLYMGIPTEGLVFYAPLASSAAAA